MMELTYSQEKEKIPALVFDVDEKNELLANAENAKRCMPLIREILGMAKQHSILSAIESDEKKHIVINIKNDKEIEIVFSNPEKFDYLKAVVSIYGESKQTNQEALLS